MARRSRSRKLQVGTTGVGADRVDVYRWPGSPFGPPATYTGQQVDEGGAERLYSMHVDEPALNFGVAVIASSPGSLVDPWLLGSVDENDVQGYDGTPVNVNSFMFNYQLDVGAAGAVLRGRRRTTSRSTRRRSRTSTRPSAASTCSARG